MKILGFGIDLEKMDRFDPRVSQIDETIIERFLTENEFVEYKKITNINGRVRFLSSHWAAKEAVYKALRVSHQPLNKIEITRLENGHLTYVPSIPNVEGLLSVTYSEKHCAVACILVGRESVASPSADLWQSLQQQSSPPAPAAVLVSPAAPPPSAVNFVAPPVSPPSTEPGAAQPHRSDQPDSVKPLPEEKPSAPPKTPQMDKLRSMLDDLTNASAKEAEKISDRNTGFQKKHVFWGF